MVNIESLTQAQRARCDEYASRWTAIGLSTEPADRPAAEAAIARIYTLAGLEPPVQILWSDSPATIWSDAARWWTDMAQVECLTQAPRSRCGESVAPGMSVTPAAWRDAMKAAMRNAMWVVVRDALMHVRRTYSFDRVPVSARRAVYEAVYIPVRDSVSANVRALLGEVIKENVVGNRLFGSVKDAAYGQHDADWLSACAYYGEVLRCDRTRLSGFMDLAKSAGWALPCRHVCFVSERHSVLHRDAQDRLHCDDGPAVAYPDGWGVWAWHGVRVSRRVIENPSSLSVQATLAERNGQLRRVMLTRIGPARLRAELPESVVDTDLDGRGMVRRLFELEGLTDRRFVSYTCPSTRTFYAAQTVPPQVRTCAEAIAWRFSALDVTASGQLSTQFDYAPAIEG